MRFTTLLTALPALAAAQDATDAFGNYKAQFQGFMDKMGSYVPNPGRHDPVAAMEAKLGSMKLHTLTLENWKSTLYSAVEDGATTPEEFWVMITGRQKTCGGHCEVVEKEFNETAGKFALQPGSPHMGMLNCEDQPILCNSWSATPSNLWVFEMLPPPAPIEIYTRRLNRTGTKVEHFTLFKNKDKRGGFQLLDSWFHPFEGKATELGIAVPFGYVVWFMNLIPQWAFMVIVSLFSRRMMGNRMAGMQQQQQRRQ